MNPHDIIHKAIFSTEDIADFMKYGKVVGAFGYRNLAIEVFDSKRHVDMYLIKAEGLGHTLYISYQFDMSRGPITIPLPSLINEIFSDFADFVLYERTEEHATIH